MCLTTVPLNFYKSLLDVIRNDFDQTRDAFLIEYNSPVIKSHQMARLSSIAQAQSETVTEFYTRLLDMALNAYDNIAVPIREALCLSHFVTGIRPQLSLQTRNTGPATLPSM